MRLIFWPKMLAIKISPFGQHHHPRPPLCGRRPAQKGGQAAQGLGRSRGGFSSKIHLSVDGLGNPLQFQLTGGQAHAITQAEALLGLAWEGLEKGIQSGIEMEAPSPPY